MPDPTYISALNSSTFIHRVKHAMVKAALAISNEADNTNNHHNRIKLASSVLSNNVNWEVCVRLVLVNSAIEALEDISSVTEADIFNAVSGFWDALSKAV